MGRAAYRAGMLVFEIERRHWVEVSRYLQASDLGHDHHQGDGADVGAFTC